MTNFSLEVLNPLVLLCRCLRCNNCNIHFKANDFFLKGLCHQLYMIKFETKIKVSILMEAQNNGLLSLCSETVDKCHWPRKMDCSLKKIGPIFQVSLVSCRHRYKLTNFCSPFKNSLIYIFLLPSFNTVLGKRKCSSF